MLSKLINLELTDSKITNYIIENYYKMLNISFSQFINDLSIEEEEAYEFLKTMDMIILMILNVNYPMVY